MGFWGRYRPHIAFTLLFLVYAGIFSEVVHRALCTIIGSVVSLVILALFSQVCCSPEPVRGLLDPHSPCPLDSLLAGNQPTRTRTRNSPLQADLLVSQSPHVGENPPKSKRNAWEQHPGRFTVLEALHRHLGHRVSMPAQMSSACYVAKMFHTTTNPIFYHLVFLITSSFG